MAITAHSNHTLAVLSGGGIMFWGNLGIHNNSLNVTLFTSPTAVDVGAGKHVLVTCIFSG